MKLYSAKEKISERLLDLLTKENDIKEILKLGEEILGCHILYSDHFSDRFFVSKSYSDKVYNHTALSEENLNTLKYEIDQLLYDSPVKDNKSLNEPFIIKTDANHKLLVSRVYYLDKPIGNIIIPRDNIDLEHIDKEKLKEIGRALSLFSIIKNATPSLPKSTINENEIFEKLLYRKFNTINDLNAFSSNYSFNRYTSFRIIGIPVNSSNLKSTIKKIKSMTKDSGLGLWIHKEKTKLIIMIGFNKNSIDTHIFLEYIENAFLNEDIVFAISDPFYHILATEQHFNHVKTLFSYINSLTSDQKIYFYDDYKFKRFLIDVNPFINWSNSYISHKIMDILNYDKNNNTDYANTLKTYLAESQSPAKVSKLLFIHRNTVIYRINRIKELFEIDFTNADQCFQLYFSFHLLLVRGWKNI